MTNGKKGLQRLLCVLLALCMLVPLMMPIGYAAQSENAAPDTAEGAEHPFSDVKEDAWYSQYVTYVWEKGLFSGVSASRFDPNGSMTRAMFVTVLGRAAEIDPEEYSAADFSDVDPDEWYAPYVAWATENGIANGMGGGLFGPKEYVTREQMAAFLYRYLKLKQLLPESTQELTYQDASKIEDYAVEAVRVCLELGLMQGDTNGSFRPKDLATRAEAAVIFTRLGELLEAQEDQQQDNPFNPSGNAVQLRYYKVKAAWPDGADEAMKAAVTLPALSGAVKAGTLISTLDIPVGAGYVFCGWYYDSALTKMVTTEDTVTANTTLYPKMAAQIGDIDEFSTGSLNYVSALDVDTDYTVQVSADSEAQIRSALSFLYVSGGDETVEYTVRADGNGLYTLIPTGGLAAGGTYQLKANDRSDTPVANGTYTDDEGEEHTLYATNQDCVLFVHDGEVQTTEIRYYNITVAATPYTNLRVNDSVKFLPIAEVSGFSIEDSAMFTTDMERIEENDISGTFVYGGNDLAVGDVVAIYRGTVGENNIVDGEAAYVKITEVNARTGVYTYTGPSLTEVIFTPDILPVPMNTADLSDVTAVNGAILNEDGTITVYQEFLDYSGFTAIPGAGLNLSGSTRADVGDYLLLYTGTLSENASDVTSYAYYEITGISISAGVNTFTVEQSTLDDIRNAVGAYEVSAVDPQLSAAQAEDLESRIAQQAIDSGFAQEAADYLASAIFSGTDLSGELQGYSLESVSVSALDGDDGSKWYEGGSWSKQDGKLQIEAGAIEAGIGPGFPVVTVGAVDVHVKVSTRLQEITSISSGARVELGLTFGVTIGSASIGIGGMQDPIYLEISASFVQEVGLKASASYDIEWDIWGIFPYISDVNISVGVDVGTYTGVGATFTVAFTEGDLYFPWTEEIRAIDSTYDPANPSVKSIAKKLEAMMNNSTTFFDGDETGDSLVKRYQELLDNDSGYMTIFEVQIFATSIPFCANLLTLRIGVEFVVNVKVNVTIGMAFEHLDVKRYTINVKLFSQKASNSTTSLQTPYTDFNVYIMGSLGLRVGPRVTMQLCVLDGLIKKNANLASVGISLEVGPQIELNGIFFYHFRMENGKTTESRGVGGLAIGIGLYLDVDVTFGLLADVVSATVHAVELSYEIWNTERNDRVLEAKRATYTTASADDIPLNLQYYTSLTTLEVRTGTVWERRGGIENFDVSISDPRFVYDAEKGVIKRKSVFQDTTMVWFQVKLTYLGSDTLFRTEPITVTINVTWTQTFPEVTMTFWDYEENALSGGGVAWADREVYSCTGIWGSAIPSDLYEKLPQPSAQAGYKFIGWYVSGKPLSEVNAIQPGHVEPKYVADYTTFTIEYYATDTSGKTDYTLLKSVEHSDRKSGTTLYYDDLMAYIDADMGDGTQLSGFNPEGLRLQFNLLPGLLDFGDGFVVTNTITGDGLTVLKVYYNRANYDVYFHANNSTYTGSYTTKVTGLYGAPLEVPESFDTTLLGYTFVGWSTSQDGSSGIIDLTDATIPCDENNGGTQISYVMGNRYTNVYYPDGTHYFAIWAPTEQTYTVNHYLRSIDGSYQLVRTETATGHTGDYMDAEDHWLPATGEFEGTTHSHVVYSDNSCRLNGSGEQVMELYYTRTYYRVYWFTQSPSAPGSNSYTVQYYYDGQAIVPPTAEDLAVPEKTGYRHTGWANWRVDGETYTEGMTMDAAHAGYSFYPTYTARDDIGYKVIHVREGLKENDFTGEGSATETETFSGTADSKVTPSTKSYDGFVTPTEREITIRPDGKTELTYKYYREQHQVTYLLTADAVQPLYTTTYRHGVSFKLRGTPEREGYDFKGWKLTGGTTDPKLLGQVYEAMDPVTAEVLLTSGSDLTFTAQWEKKTVSYTVEHYLEQLDGSYALQQSDPKTGTFGDTVNASAATFSGFTWDEAVEGTVTGAVLDRESGVTLKLYYTRNGYTVTWYASDEATVLDTTTVKYGAAITPPADTDFTSEPGRIGYTITGWDTAYDYGTMPAAETSFSTADCGLWTPNSYTVVFDGNGATGGSMTNQSFTYGVSRNLTANAYTKAGSVFGGWAKQANGNVVYADKAPVSNLTSEPNGTVTLYAVWLSSSEQTAYTVEYYLENTDGSYTKADEQTDTLYAPIHTPTVSVTAPKAIAGYAFDGSNPNNVTSAALAEDGSTVLKLYYQRAKYALTLNWNGTTMKKAEGAGSLSTYSIDNDTVWVKCGLSLSDAVSEVSAGSYPGYTFGGWCTDAACTAALTSDAVMPIGGTTLYARWDPIRITVIWYSGSKYGGWNDITGETYTMTCFYGDEVELPTQVNFTNGAYRIVGWNFNDGSGGNGQYPVLTTWPLVLVYGYYGTDFADGTVLELSPYWSNYYSTIVFNGNGADGGSMEEQYVERSYGSDEIAGYLTKNKYTRAGYSFAGWSTVQDPGEGDTIYSDGAWAVLTDDGSGTVTLYAQWTPDN